MCPRSLPQLSEDGRIVEGVMTTLNSDGSLNVSPMGPIVDDQFSVFVFRPYQTSRTFQNLDRHRQGVFHVTDDVRLIAKAAVSEMAILPETTGTEVIEGKALTNACRWYEVKVESVDVAQERSTVVARTVATQRNRDFLGFNRAQAAVIEAAILATRIHILPAEDILSAVKQLESPVTKTGGQAELNAYEFLCEYIHRELATSEAHA